MGVSAAGRLPQNMPVVSTYVSELGTSPASKTASHIADVYTTSVEFQQYYR